MNQRCLASIRMSRDTKEIHHFTQGLADLDAGRNFFAVLLCHQTRYHNPPVRHTIVGIDDELLKIEIRCYRSKVGEQSRNILGICYELNILEWNVSAEIVYFMAA